MSSSTVDDTPSLYISLNSSSPALVYEEGVWMSQIPTSRMMNAAIFPQSPISDKLVTLGEGQTEGSVFLNFTERLGITVMGTVDFTEYAYSAADTPRIYCDVSPKDGSDNVTGTGLSKWVPLQEQGQWQAHSIALCLIENLTPTKEYMLNFTLVQKVPRQIWFDAVALRPEHDARLDGTTVGLLPKSPLIGYTGNWTDLSVSLGAFVTSTKGAKVELDFNGTSVKWLTGWQEGLGTEGSQGVWTVDGKYSQTFNIPGINSTSDGRHISGNLLFQTPDFPPGRHRLEVTYDPVSDSNSARPLSLWTLFIQHAFTPSDATNLNGRRKAIAIGVGIPCAILLITIMGLVHRRRKRKKRRVRGIENLSSDISPYQTQDQPSNSNRIAPKWQKGMPVAGSTSTQTQAGSSDEVGRSPSRGHEVDDEPPPYAYNASSSDRRITVDHESRGEQPEIVKSGLPNFDVEARAAYLSASAALRSGTFSS